MFVIDGDDLGASVARPHRVYATSVAVPTGTGRWQRWCSPITSAGYIPVATPSP
jgi:hypothetical protein